MVRRAPTLRVRCIGAGVLGLIAALAGGCGGEIDGESAGHSTSTGDASTLVARDAAGGRGGPPQDDGAAPSSCSGGACPSPGDVSGFVPTWKPPTGAHQRLCTTALVDEYYQDCLAVSGAQSCAVFGPAGDPAHQACARCLTSGFDDATWAPVVESANVVETNGAGCIALLDPSALECAKSVQALDQCEHAACDPTCHTGSASTFDDWVQCSAAANACGCQSWFAASDCVKQIAAGAGPAAACLVGQTFQDFFEVTASAFCGD
jgi:hypothetical protein